MNTDEVIQNITDKVQKTANVKVVFGDPVKEGRITIIPVAKTSVKGGGGGGKGEDEKVGRGGGVGLGMVINTTPIGYIKIDDDEAVFIEILDKSRIMIAGFALAGITLLALGGIIKK
jgi:uncharacterized spore protein YtfJ